VEINYSWFAKVGIEDLQLEGVGVMCGKSTPGKYQFSGAKTFRYAVPGIPETDG
jgi:hypothetical protein